MTKARIAVIIPAFNEERSIALVVGDIPRDVVNEIIVVNNGSTDRTAAMAERAGAIVLEEKARGYGNACLCGIACLTKESLRPDLVVFLDADYSDYPEEIPMIIKPLLTGTADLVIGSRATGAREAGSMAPQQVFGNWLATRLIRLFYGVKFTDLGPFRAIRYDALMSLGMCDRNYGWTVEMQVKAAKHKLRCLEVPVRYRRRIGVSKVSGTIKGTLSAGYKIIVTIFKYL
jgi:glycosyltransferase involved in cell wall biosynthesis